MPPRRPPPTRPRLPIRRPLPAQPMHPLPVVRPVALVRRHHAPAAPIPARQATLPPPIPVAPATAPSPAGYRGPDPYVDFQRDFTDEGGIRLTVKVRDPQAWRTFLRVVLWLAAMAVTLWFAFRASPFPVAPPRCAGGVCPDGVRNAHVGGNFVLMTLAAIAYAWILFPEDQTYATLEVRHDCLIVDGCDTFWRQHMDLGWPQLVPGPDGSSVLRGVYGTREIDYLTLHAIDEKDRTVPVLGAHLQFAMQQLWSHPLSES